MARAAESDSLAIRTLVREGMIGARILASSAYAGNEEQETATLREHNEVARIAREESRLGIPVLTGRDVLHGYRTVFPVPLAMAASWNPDAVEQAAAFTARETRSQGIHWTFAPNLDICRDPRWGRVFEGFGEDPYLAGKMAEASVKGLQGRTDEDLRSEARILACAKHFAGYGAPDGGRDYHTVELSEHTLRNIHLIPFLRAVEAGVGSFMSGFHDWNGESVSGSSHLLETILRKEWRATGFVVSDWASVEDLMRHRLAANRCEASALSFNAGVDMDMCSGCYLENLETLLESGKVSQSRLDTAVCRVLTAKFQLGLFENSHTEESAGKSILLHPDHVRLARRLAGDSMVLLKNNGILPLSKMPTTVAVVGSFARERRSLLGGWTLDGLIEDTPSLIEAIVEAAPEISILEAGSPEDIASAVQKADVVVLAIGESIKRNGENNSLAEIELPPGDHELIRLLATFEKPLIIVVCPGRPLVLTDAVRNAGALLLAWNAGTEMARAIADILFGEVNPSGKLPMSFPRATGQIPVYYNHKGTGHGPMDSSYKDMPYSPLFPFGFGLSYTCFRYDDARVDGSDDESVTVSVEVHNVGDRAGTEVVQCYVQDCIASVTRPLRELKGFKRITLEPGQSRRVDFKLGREELGFFRNDGGYAVEPGTFKAGVGGCSSIDLNLDFQWPFRSLPGND